MWGPPWPSVRLPGERSCRTLLTNQTAVRVPWEVRNAPGSAVGFCSFKGGCVPHVCTRELGDCQQGRGLSWDRASQSLGGPAAPKSASQAPKCRVPCVPRQQRRTSPRRSPGVREGTGLFCILVAGFLEDTPQPQQPLPRGARPGGGRHRLQGLQPDEPTSPFTPSLSSGERAAVPSPSAGLRRLCGPQTPRREGIRGSGSPQPPLPPLSSHGSWRLSTRTRPGPYRLPASFHDAPAQEEGVPVLLTLASCRGGRP